MNETDVSFSLGRLEAKLDAVISLLDSLKADTEHRLDEQEKRITDLENWKAGLMGKFAGAALAIGIVFTILSKLL